MKLFVGRLPFELSQNELQELFEQFGKVKSATIITDRDTGRSKGFGFVEMADATEAQEAIKKLNESEVKGRAIVVSEARDRERTGGGSGPRERSGGGGFRDRNGSSGGRGGERSDRGERSRRRF